MTEVREYAIFFGPCPLGLAESTKLSEQFPSIVRNYFIQSPFLAEAKGCAIGRGGRCWPATATHALFFWLPGTVAVFIFLNLPHQFSASCQTEKREREGEREGSAKGTEIPPRRKTPAR